MERLPKVEVSCNYCEKKFFKKASNLKVHPISYCSLKCKGFKDRQENSKILNCSICNKEYCIPKSQYKKESSKFCSQSCYGQSKLTGFNIECNNCPKKVYRTRFELAHKDFHFCSKKCFFIFYKKTTNQERTNKNSYILDQIDKKSYTKYFSIPYRHKAITHYGLKCQSPNCLINSNNIELDPCQFDVDHIDGNRDNNNLTNLQVLCCLCHSYKTRIVKNEI